MKVVGDQFKDPKVQQALQTLDELFRDPTVQAAVLEDLARRVRLPDGSERWGCVVVPIVPKRRRGCSCGQQGTTSRAFCHAGAICYCPCHHP